MVKLHTSQLNFGKVLKGRPKMGFIDTTVKSGGEFAKAYLAPTWDMVKMAHGGELDRYCDLYMKMLLANRETIVTAIEGWVRKAGITDLVLGCYDAGEKFCHRHLLKRFLLEHGTAFERGGEVSNETIFRGDIPNDAVVLVAGTVAERQALYEILKTDIGSHAMSAISEAKIDSVEARLSAINEIFVASEKEASNGSPTYIDLSELGNNLLELADIKVSGEKLVCQGPRVGNDATWHVVFGDTVHADIRRLMFKPAFELCPTVADTEFEKKMDDYYNRSITNAKNGVD